MHTSEPTKQYAMCPESLLDQRSKLLRLSFYSANTENHLPLKIFAFALP